MPVKVSCLSKGRRASPFVLQEARELLPAGVVLGTVEHVLGVIGGALLGSAHGLGFRIYAGVVFGCEGTEPLTFKRTSAIMQAESLEPCK